jgi:hypothetical protein
LLYLSAGSASFYLQRIPALPFSSSFCGLSAVVILL